MEYAVHAARDPEPNVFWAECRFSERVSWVSNVQRVLMLTDSDQIRSSAKSVVAVCKVYCVRAG